MMRSFALFAFLTLLPMATQAAAIRRGEMQLQTLCFDSDTELQKAFVASGRGGDVSCDDDDIGQKCDDAEVGKMISAACPKTCGACNMDIEEAPAPPKECANSDSNTLRQQLGMYNCCMAKFMGGLTCSDPRMIKHCARSCRICTPARSTGMATATHYNATHGYRMLTITSFGTGTGTSSDSDNLLIIIIISIIAVVVAMAGLWFLSCVCASSDTADMQGDAVSDDKAQDIHKPVTVGFGGRDCTTAPDGRSCTGLFATGESAYPPSTGTVQMTGSVTTPGPVQYTN